MTGFSGEHKLVRLTKMENNDTIKRPNNPLKWLRRIACKCKSMFTPIKSNKFFRTNLLKVLVACLITLYCEGILLLFFQLLITICIEFNQSTFIPNIFFLFFFPLDTIFPWMLSLLLDLIFATFSHKPFECTPWNWNQVKLTKLENVLGTFSCWVCEKNTNTHTHTEEGEREGNKKECAVALVFVSLRKIIFPFEITWSHWLATDLANINERKKRQRVGHSNWCCSFQWMRLSGKKSDCWMGCRGDKRISVVSAFT